MTEFERAVWGTAVRFDGVVVIEIDPCEAIKERPAPVGGERWLLYRGSCSLHFNRSGAVVDCSPGESFEIAEGDTHTLHAGADGALLIGSG